MTGEFPPLCRLRTELTIEEKAVAHSEAKCIAKENWKF